MHGERWVLRCFIVFRFLHLQQNSPRYLNLYLRPLSTMNHSEINNPFLQSSGLISSKLWFYTHDLASGPLTLKTYNMSYPVVSAAIWLLFFFHAASGAFLSQIEPCPDYCGDKDPKDWTVYSSWHPWASVVNQFCLISTFTVLSTRTLSSSYVLATLATGCLHLWLTWTKGSLT